MTVATGRTISKNALKELLAYHQIENYFDEFMSYGEMDHTKVVQAKDVNKKAMFDYLLNKTNTDYENSWYVTDIAEDAHRALDLGFAKVFGTTTGGINPELFSAEITVITSLDEVNI